MSFTKRVPIVDREQYINDCCIGGDVVANRLLPAVRARYGDDDIEPTEEDWGWFIWFRKGGVRLAIDIFTDGPDEGAFRIHLTSRTKRFLMFDTVVDTSELEELRALVVAELEAWGCNPVRIVHLE